MYYIFENDNLEKDKLYNFFINLTRFVRLEGNQIIISPLSKTKRKKNEKIQKRTIDILNKTNCRKVVLSKKLKDEKEFINYLYSNNLDIVDARFLFTILAQEVLEYIIEKACIDKEKLKIGILVNDINFITLANIRKIANENKSITIVTRHSARLKKLQNDLYEKEGIILTVTNNKRKALFNTNIILNFDFPEEVVNKFTIYEKAVIINFTNRVKIYKKRFNGININDYEIEVKESKLKELVGYDEELIKRNYIKDIYEANLYKNQSFETLKKTLQDDKVKIKYLCGNTTKY